MKNDFLGVLLRDQRNYDAMGPLSQFGKHWRKGEPFPHRATPASRVHDNPMKVSIFFRYFYIQVMWKGVRTFQDKESGRTTLACHGTYAPLRFHWISGRHLRGTFQWVWPQRNNYLGCWDAVSRSVCSCLYLIPISRN